jgi:hypothetical protein
MRRRRRKRREVKNKIKIKPQKEKETDVFLFFLRLYAVVNFALIPAVRSHRAKRFALRRRGI